MVIHSKQNVDPAEIEKFAEMAENWWDTQGTMKPLHQLNSLRLQYIKNHGELTNKKVLDIGCGGGILTESLAQAQAKVTGIDLNEVVLMVAREHRQQQQLSIDYQFISSAELAEKLGAHFDVITCMELLEHVPNPEELVHDCAQLIKPGGKVFFSTINRNFKSFLGAIIGAEYLFNLLPKGTHHYAQFIQPAELSRWARKANLDLCHLQGIQYHPFKQQFHFSRDLSINYLACYQKN